MVHSSFHDTFEFVDKFFKEFIFKNIIPDLKVLDQINPNGIGGLGACCIPQAITTFSTIDLFGYLLGPENMKEMDMRFIDFLKNRLYFPNLESSLESDNFWNSLRDELRSLMVHRFIISKYSIAKVDVDKLFVKIEQSNEVIFNVRFFTKITLNAVDIIYHLFLNQELVIEDLSFSDTIDRLRMKVESLINLNRYNVDNISNITSISTTIQTTRPPKLIE